MKRYVKVLFALITLVLLIYFLLNINFLELYNVLQKISTFYFFLAFISYSLAFLMFNLRSTYSLKWIVRPDFWFFQKTTLAGFFINTITPGAQIGGDPLKAYILSKKYKKPFSKIFGAIFADKIIHTLISLFFILFSVLFLITFIPLPSGLTFILQIFLFLIFLVFAIIPLFGIIKTKLNLKFTLRKLKWLAWLNPVKNNEKLQKEIGKKLGSFTKSFRKTITNKKIFTMGIIFSLIYWFLNYLVSYFLFLSLGFEINFFFVIIVVSLGSLVGVFSPSPGGVGFIEGFMIFLYSIIGVNFATAVVVSLLSRMIFYFHSLIVGGISLISLKKYFK